MAYVDVLSIHVYIHNNMGMDKLLMWDMLAGVSVQDGEKQLITMAS